MKVCLDCGVAKPLTSFSKRKNYRKTDTVYHFAYCKPCRLIRTEQWRKDRPDLHYKYQNSYIRKKVHPIAKAIRVLIKKLYDWKENTKSFLQ